MTQVLVTGATGTVGRHVTRGLTETDTEVRAGVRSVSPAGEALPDDVELVRFDFEKPETWGAAFESVDSLNRCSPYRWRLLSTVSRHFDPTLSNARATGHTSNTSSSGSGFGGRSSQAVVLSGTTPHDKKLARVSARNL